jgi:hypothetical protein
MSHLNSPRGIYQLEKILERLDSIDETLKEILKELKKGKHENKPPLEQSDQIVLPILTRI